MRGLFKNQADITLFAVEIRDAYYDPENNWLCFETEDEDVVIVPYFTRDAAHKIIRTLYEDGKADFSHHLAYFNEEPPTFSKKKE